MMAEAFGETPRSGVPMRMVTQSFGLVSSSAQIDKERLVKSSTRALIAFLSFLVFLTAVPITDAQAATWTFRPELRRLDPSDNALPAGTAAVTRADTLRVGFYMHVSTDGVAPVVDDSNIGFDSLAGAIHFTSNGLAITDIGPIVSPLASAAGWSRRLTGGTTFPAGDDATFLGPPGETANENRWAFFWDDALGRADPKGAWCVPVSGSCTIFIGVLEVGLSSLPVGAGGALSLKVAGATDLAGDITVMPMYGRADAAIMESNTITYNIPVQGDFGAAAYTVTEGATVDVAVTLSRPLGEAVTVPIQARTGAGAGTAPAGAYSLPTTSSVTFAAGETSKTITVTAPDNSDDAAAETQTLILEFGDLSALTVLSAGTQATTTITITDDDDPSVAISFGAATYTATEGDSAGATVAVTLTPTGPATTPEREVIIAITTALQGGASTGDFSGVPASLTFAAGDTGAALTKTFIVTATEESDRDQGESVALGFGAPLPSGVTAGSPASTTVMLRDNDSDGIELAITSPANLTEVATSTNITVTATLDLVSASSLSSSTVVTLMLSGTASSGTDYTPPGTLPTITFPSGAADGATATATLTLTPANDAVVEDAETIIVSGSATGFSVTATDIELIDTDTATVSIAAPSVAVSEGSAAAFMVTLSAPVDADVTVTWSATDGTATVADDLAATTTGSVTFAANSAAGATQTVSVTVTDDDLSEVAENFTVTLGAVTGDLASRASRITVNSSAASASATISASDPLMVSLTGPAQGVEGTNREYTVSLSGGTSTADVVVPIVVAAGSTALAADYTVPLSITIPAGMRARTFTIAFATDNSADDGETLIVQLGSVSGGGGSIAADSTASAVTITIREALLVSMARAAVSASEEGAMVDVQVDVDPAPQIANLTVSYTLSPGTAVASDYTDASGGSITINVGQSSGTIQVRTVNDPLSEMAEIFTVQLTGVVSSVPDQEPAELAAVAADITTEVTIPENDPLTVSLSSERDEVREGTAATYTVSLSGGTSTAAVTVAITFMSARSEANADDFTVIPVSVTIPSGQPSATFTFDIVKDEVKEDEETLILAIGTVTGGGGGSIMPATASGAPVPVTITIIEVNLEQRARAITHTLAAFGRTIASNLVGVVEDRAAATQSSSGSQATLAGETLSLTTFRSAIDDSEAENGKAEKLALAQSIKRLLGMSADTDGNVTFRPASPELMLSRSSFDLALGGDTPRSDGALVLWGRGAASGFEGRPESGFSMDGNVLSGHVGADFRAPWDLLAGVALSYNEGDTDYRFAGGTAGKIDTTLFSIHPYVHWQPLSGFGIWATAGYGEGDTTLNDGDTGPVKTDIDMLMGAVGARAALLSVGGIDLALKGDAFHVRVDAQERADLIPDAGTSLNPYSQRLRLALEGSTEVMFAGGSALTGSIEIGGRLDNGDAEKGVGAEFGGSVAYAHPALGLEVGTRGRVLLAHQASGFKEWGAGLTASIDPGAAGRGLSLSLAPTLGNASSGVDGLWESARSVETRAGDPGATRATDPNMTMAAQVGYGLGLLDNRALLTPFSALNLSNGSSRWRMGTSLTMSATRTTNLEFEFYNEQESAGGKVSESSIVFDSRVKRSIGRGLGAVELFSKLESSDTPDYQVGLRARMNF